MNDIIRTILIMSASGSIVAAALFLIKPLLRNRLPKFTQYYLWIIVLLAFLVPVSQIIVLPTGPVSQITAETPVAAPAFIPTISETVTRFAVTQTEYTQRQRQTAPTGHMPQAQQSTSPITFFMTYFVLVYPFGVLVLLLWYAINYVVYYIILRRRNIVADPGYRAVLNEMCKGRAPRLYFNPLATTPMLIGIFRPRIILPDREYTYEQLIAILAHELTHLRRKDIFVKLLTLVASAVHWFNPFVWLIRREIDRACELACDEAVIQKLDKDGKRVYGNTLISVSAKTKAPKVITSAMMCEDKKNLKERLGAIMRSKSHTKLAIIFSALIILLTACGALALGVGSSENENDSTAQISNETTANNEEVTDSNDSGNETTQPEPDPNPGALPPLAYPIIYITHMNAEHLSLFDTFHQFDFLEAYADYHNLDDDNWFFQIEGEWGVVVWAEIPLRSFQVIALAHRDDDTVTAGNVFYEMDVLPAGTPFFINRFVTPGGVLPWEGISFVDPSGVRRYFAIADDRRGDPGDPPYFLLEFENGSDMWGLVTTQTPINLGLATADYLYASRIDLNAVARRAQAVTGANQSADALIWIVEPALPHQSIRLCNCGSFVDQDWNIIDPATGQLTGDYHFGHGGQSPALVYDANLGLIGHTGFGDGYHSLLGLVSPAEFMEVFPDWYIEYVSGLTAVELVDSTLRQYWEWQEGSWELTEDAFLGQFALMYNHQFTTAFAFNEIRIARIIDNFRIAETLSFAAVRVDNLWGVVDINGNVVIPYMFEDLTFIDANTAFARVNGAYGILDVSENLMGLPR